MNKYAEQVALAFLVTLGATALDSGMMEEKRRLFERRFGVEITDKNIVSVIKQVRHMLSGSEEVVGG